MGDELVDHEEVGPELYRRGETGPKKGDGVRMNGFEHKLGPQPELPSLEELNAPAPKKPKARKPKAKRDAAVDKAADKDLKTRGIK